MSGRARTISDDALLAAAARVLRRTGARATSEAIAREAGVSKALLFARYKTKQDLIAAVIDREAQVPDTLLERVDDVGRGPIGESLVQLGTELLAILRRVAPFADLARSSPDCTVLLCALRRSRAAPPRLLQLCVRYFEAEVALARLPALPCSVLGRLFFGPLLERVLAETAPGRPFFLEDHDEVFLRELVYLVLHGALSPLPHDVPLDEVA